MKNLTSTLIITVLLTVSFSCSQSEKDQVIQPGEGIHHDDFEYVVDEYKVTTKIGDDSAAVGKSYYIIKFSVVNNALRVNHKWNNSVAYVIDDDGTVYDNVPELQAKLNNAKPFGLSDEYTTSYQSTSTTYFVFEVPAEIKKPYLMVRGETLMGDFFDGNQFKKTKVKLF